METITIAKALRTIVLPDGKTVHEGDEFVYEHNFENCGEFEIVCEKNGDKAPAPQQPEKDPEKPATLSVEEMKDIRLKAKDLKIANWHTKGIERLLKEIDEAEDKPEKDPEVVASEMENTTAAPAPEQPVADNLTPTDGAAANA